MRHRAEIVFFRTGDEAGNDGLLAGDEESDNEALK